MSSSSPGDIPPPVAVPIPMALPAAAVAPAGAAKRGASLGEINHQLLMALMEIIPDRIYFKDRESRFIAVNKALIEFFGVERAADLLGRTTFDILLPEYAQKTRDDEVRIMGTGEPMIGDVEKKVFPDGRMKWASTTKAPLRDHFGEIIGICGISRDVTQEHEQARKLEEYAETLAEKQAQMGAELEMARQVQQALLPSRYPLFPPTASEAASALAFAHRYQPMGKVGGDFFTVIPIGARQAGVFLCDVMGHGVHAALITAMQRTLVDDLLPFSASPGAFLAEANRRLHPFFERMRTPIYVAGLYAAIDSETGRVRFSGASHVVPLVVPKDGGPVRPLGGPKKLPPSVPLGFMAESAYAEFDDEIAPGDRLFFFTDGLRDLGDGARVGYDDPFFLGLVARCAARPEENGKGFLDYILEEVAKTEGAEGFLDDVCLVEVLYRGPAPHGQPGKIGPGLTPGPYGL